MVNPAQWQRLSPISLVYPFSLFYYSPQQLPFLPLIRGGGRERYFYKLENRKVENTIKEEKLNDSQTNLYKCEI